MCIQVYNRFDDISCQHREYQNTSLCHVARRCCIDDDQALQESVFLPTKPPNVPPGLFGCKVRTATRPVKGKCRDCRRRAKLAEGDSNSTNSTMRSSTSASSANSTASRLLTPIPSYRALAQVQDSFSKVSREQQLTPPSIGLHRGRRGY